MAALPAEERRERLARLLAEAEAPVSASALARRLGVSRQVIVGDVALLRAGGAAVVATPRGYLAAHRGEVGVLRVVACVHPPERMGEELTAIVDAGGEVLDVVVEHPVYGQLTGQLRIRSRYEVREFLRRVEEERARPLSDLTDGIHLHTIRAPDEDACRRVLEALEEKGFLLSP